MTATIGYLTPQDLIDAIGQTAYMAVFDDAGTGSPSTVNTSTQVATVLARTWAWIQSWLPNIYADMPPSANAAGVPSGSDGIPRLLKDAQLQYAVILTYRRHPEYAETYGAQPGGLLMKELTELMQRIQSSTQRIASNDSPPDALPTNVGGHLRDNGPHLFANPDGCNGSDF